MSQTYHNYKAQGICARCGKEPSLAPKHIFCQKCKDYQISSATALRKFRKDNNLCRTCAKPTKDNRSLCDTCNDKHISKTKERGIKIKKEVFNMYGGICTCCGENEINILQIDHIAGITPGKDDKTGPDFYRWLKKNKYPKDYQLLCGSCNWSKGLFGICPHQQNVNNLLSKCIQVGSSV